MSPAQPNHPPIEPCVDSRPIPTSQESWASLMALLEGENRQLDQNREALRQQMADLEWQLQKLTSQQAELQTLQVAIDRVLTYLRKNFEEGPGNQNHWSL